MTVERITELAERGEDVFEMAVAAGQSAREDMDAGRWTIGDLALVLGKRYGSDVMSEFAKAVNVNVSSAREYRQVCAFWQSSVRAEFLALPTISYSHLKIAMRLKDFKAACDFVEECAKNAWTCEQAAVELALRKGKRAPLLLVMDCEQARLESADGILATFTLDVLACRKLRDSTAGAVCRVKVYVEPPPESESETQ